MNNIIDAKGESNNSQYEHEGQDKKKSQDKVIDDTIGRIRNEDLNKRICTRNESEKNFDILLSGTSATIVI